MKIQQLTFSRFLAAMVIVIYHFGRDVYPFDSNKMGTITSYFHTGVSYFFILSGFIMIVAYGNYEKVDVLSYYKHRFARIYPLLIVSVIPIFTGGLLGYGDNNVADSLLNLISVQAWMPGLALAGNGPAWSLTVEVFFYLIFPFLFNRLYKKVSLKTLSIVIILFWLTSAILQNYLLKSGFNRGYPSASHDFLYYFPLLHLNQFLMGNLAGLWFMSCLKDIKRNVDFLLVAVIALLLIVLKYPLGIDYHNGFLAIIFIPLILLQAINVGITKSAVSTQLFIFLGEISYAIYILQYPVYQVTLIGLNKLGIADPVLRFYLFVFILLTISAICHVLIENPLRERIKRIKIK